MGKITFNNSIGHTKKFQLNMKKEAAGITFQMQLLMNYESVKPFENTLSNINDIKDFVYSNKTKTIFSFVGDQVIGENTLSGFKIIAKQFRFVQIDQNVTGNFLGIPTAWSNITRHYVDILGDGDAILIPLTADQKAGEVFY